MTNDLSIANQRQKASEKIYLGPASSKKNQEMNVDS